MISKGALDLAQEQMYTDRTPASIFRVAREDKDTVLPSLWTKLNSWFSCLIMSFTIFGAFAYYGVKEDSLAGSAGL